MRHQESALTEALKNWCSFSAATSVSTCMQRDTTYVKGYMAWQNQLLFNQLQSMFSDEIPGPLNPVNVLAPGLLLASNAMGNMDLRVYSGVILQP